MCKKAKALFSDLNVSWLRIIGFLSLLCGWSKTVSKDITFPSEFITFSLLEKTIVSIKQR